MGSLELTNEEPFVGDIRLPSTDEIKQRVFGYFATQNRAVTAADYQAICYGMPGQFGAIKRASCMKDNDALKRNLNLYVVSQDASGKLAPANRTLKNNLKTWISQYRMVNDTVDILDATIVNFGLRYTISIDMNSNRYTVMSKTNAALAEFLERNQYDIGEGIRLSDFYRILQKVDGVVSVINVEAVSQTGASYARASYDFKKNLSGDGLFVQADQNMIFELKFPNVDIKGSIQ